MPDMLHQNMLYKAREREWLEARDFYRAGRHVLEPGRVIEPGRVSYVPTDAVPADATAGGSSTERRSSLGRFVNITNESYLHAHPRESLESFRERRARATHYPLFRSVVDIYVSATLQTAPMRTHDGEHAHPVWSTYWKDVDLQGTSIDGFVRDALTWALVYGVVFAVTDKPRFANPAKNRQQQLDRGERAYSYLVSPLDVIDWKIDPKTGRFAWVNIRECAPDNRLPGQEQATPDYWVRSWRADGWTLYRPEGRNGWQVEDEGTHTLGEPPVSVLFARRGPNRLELDADSMLSGLVRGDRAALNYRSLLDEVMYNQAFASLWVPDDEGSAPGPIDIGVGIANGYNAQNGVPLLLSPEASLLMSIWQIQAEHINMLRQTYGVGRGKAEYSKEERSAAALQVESRHETTRVASLAECCEDFDTALHRHVSRWEGTEAPPPAEYSRDVSLRALSHQINDAFALKKLGVPWGAMREVIKPLVAEHMKEQGRTKESIEAAVAALNDAPDPEAVTSVVEGAS